MDCMDHNQFVRDITRRYGGASLEALEKIMVPKLIPIKEIDFTIFKVEGQKHYRATFNVEITEDIEGLLQLGRTGKFVPRSFFEGGPWYEICKGRIIEVNEEAGIAVGEIYTGSNSKKALETAITNLTTNDFLEIDQFGAAAKILSGLVENALVDIAKSDGYKVRRMPEDVARHLRAYYNYDFEFSKDGVTKKIEVKSLWGTNTRYARLIHSLGNGYETSSCKFETQDIFAVSLFLRTGNINDFAFARSVSEFDKSYGLPSATNYINYVHQNPVCMIGDGKWYATIDEVWELE